jgi:ribosome-associated translation inhibitor RaiA
MLVGMNISIHAHHLDLPRDLPAFLDKHVTRPLVRLYDDPAAELSVHLGDARRKKGGVDRECRLSFRMPGAHTLHVGSTEDDLYKALLDASERLRRHVRKQVSRMRSTSRKPVHRPLGRTWRERSTRSGLTPDGEPAAL